MRRFLDALYRGAGWAAAFAIFLIFALVAVQVSARMLDGVLRLIGFTPIGFIVPSIAEICGFLLAIASFLALAHTLVVGGHIRVGVLLDRLPTGARRPLETAVGLAATALSVYAAIAIGRLAWKSWSFNDVSYGMIPVPLALPQGLMTLGLTILAIALLDVTVRAWREGSYLKGGES